MENNRYTNTLAEVSAKIVDIKEVGVPAGLLKKHIEDGFQLCDGYAVLESKKDTNGFYIGATGMDGMYLATENRYEPVYDENGYISAFRQIDPCVLGFSPEQQSLIAQYALNSKDNLMHDLSALLKTNLPAELHELVHSTISQLSYLPNDSCRQLMADLYWVYRERNLRSIQEQLTQHGDYDPEE